MISTHRWFGGRGLSGLVFASVLGVAATSAGAARKEAKAAVAADGDVELRPIDLATVRIFGVEGVSETEADGKTGIKRLVAVVDAGHGSGVVVDGWGSCSRRSTSSSTRRSLP